MPYNDPIRKEYAFSALSVASAFTRNIRGPKGKRGKVSRLTGDVTTTIAFSTLPPIVTVTTTVAPVPNRKGGTVYSASTIVFTATLTALTAPVGFTFEQYGGVTGNNVLGDENSLPFTVPADSDLVFALAAAVGTPSGTIDLTLEMAWF